MAFETHLEEHRRLALLQLMAEAPRYQLNETVLDDALDGLGIRSSADQVRNALNWLAEQQLASVTEMAGLKVARITARGLDAAKGDIRLDGLARPAP